MYTQPGSQAPSTPPRSGFVGIPVPERPNDRAMPALANSRMFADLAKGIGGTPFPILLPSLEDRQRAADAAANDMADVFDDIGDFFSADGAGGKEIERSGSLRLIESSDGARRLEAKQFGEWQLVAPVEVDDRGVGWVNGDLIDAAPNGGYDIPADWKLESKRADPNFPKLTTRTDVARKEATHVVEGLKVWRAHHLIPFNVAAGLPFDLKLKMASTDWKMDSSENIVALPPDFESYISVPNRRKLPYHSSSHPKYDAEIEALLISALSNPEVVSKNEIEAAIRTVEISAMRFLLQPGGDMHPRVN